MVLHGRSIGTGNAGLDQVHDCRLPSDQALANALSGGYVVLLVLDLLSARRTLGGGAVDLVGGGRFLGGVPCANMDRTCRAADGGQGNLPSIRARAAGTLPVFPAQHLLPL